MPLRLKPLLEPIASWLWPAGSCAVVSALVVLAERSGQLAVALVGALLVGGLLAWRERALWILCLTDPLTGLANRRGFQRRFERELLRARRDGESLALVLIDCDRFKQLNDAHGHAAGDWALELLARTLRAAVRSDDVVGRWGGDEFVVLLRQADEADVRRVATRVNAALADERGKVRFTVSFGCVTRAAHEAKSVRLSSLLSAADGALYQAKRRGGAQLAAWREPALRPFDFEQHTPPIRGS